MKTFIAAFVTIFLAELGDKTQIATVLFAADKGQPKLVIFLAAALALVATTALGVIAGSALANVVEPKTLKTIGGIGFLAVGIWTLLST